MMFPSGVVLVVVVRDDAVIKEVDDPFLATSSSSCLNKNDTESRFSTTEKSLSWITFEGEDGGRIYPPRSV